MSNVKIVAFAEARRKLTKPAFLLWIHLHVLPDEAFKSGRRELAKATLLGPARFDEVVRELSLKGYVTVLPSDKPFGKTIFGLSKKCALPSKSRFVRFKEMAAVEYVGGDNETAGEGTTAMASTMSRVSVAREQGKTIDAKVKAPGNPATTKQQAKSDDDTQTRVRKKRAFDFDTYREVRVYHRQEVLGITVDDDDYDNSSMFPLGTPVREKEEKRRESKSERSDDVRQGESAPLRSARAAKAAPTKEARAGKFPSWKDKPKVRGIKELMGDRVGEPIPWAELDKNGDPKVSFALDDKKRMELIALIESDGRRLGNARREERTMIIKKLGEEFKRIYVRYRRFEARESGNATFMSFSATPRETPMYEEAALACIMKGITPIQYLQHWHENFSKMTHGQCFVPPMTFLKNATHADTAALSIAARRSQGVEGGRPREGYAQELARRLKANKIDTSVGFGNEKLLHPKFRSWLKQGGWDVEDKNNAYLATVQVHAIEYCDTQLGKAALPTLASDIPRSMRDMAIWASENVFADMTYGERGVYLGLIRGDMC